MTTRLEKPVRREIDAGMMGLRFGYVSDDKIIVELSKFGITFRPKGRRFRMTVPWRDAYRYAEHLTGELAHREKLREAAVRRHARRP